MESRFPLIDGVDAGELSRFLIKKGIVHTSVSVNELDGVYIVVGTNMDIAPIMTELVGQINDRKSTLNAARSEIANFVASTHVLNVAQLNDVVRKLALILQERSIE